MKWIILETILYRERLLDRIYSGGLVFLYDYLFMSVALIFEQVLHKWTESVDAEFQVCIHVFMNLRKLDETWKDGQAQMPKSAHNSILISRQYTLNDAYFLPGKTSKPKLRRMTMSWLIKDIVT